MGILRTQLTGCLILVIALCALSEGKSKRGGSLIKINTPKQQRPTYSYTNLNKYDYTLYGRKTFEFEAKACNDAHVALIGPDGENDILYEIVIGGWQNRQSVIRKTKQGRQVCFNRGRYLHCHHHQRFKVTWYNGEIKVLRLVHNRWKTFMKCRNPKPLDVKSIGVSGALWADVSWKIIKPGGKCITIKTPKQRPTYSYTNLNKYGYTPYGKKTFEFEAKGCNDAHVALIGPGGENDILYEIVIGGWQNRQSVIRQRKQGRQVCFNRGRYLDCHQYRRFKITWYNGEIKVLRYVNNVWTDFMAWRDPKPLDVKSIGVSGALWADVSWKIKIQETPTTSYLKSELLCEHKTKTIRCDGGKNIKITKALYGRHKKSICPQKYIRTTNCEAKTSMSKVREACDGKETCVLSASNSVFGDPCRGTVKYLEVQYTCVNTGGRFHTINTPKQQRPTYSYTNLNKYDYTLYGRKTFEFEAKACNDAVVALIGPDGENDILYEIVIGGWQNSRSVIRKTKQGPEVCFNVGRYLHCHHHQRFKVTWYNGEIKVLRLVHNRWRTFMKWRNPKPLDVKSIGVSGALWADVSWKIIKPGGKFIKINTPKQRPTYSYTNLNKNGYTPYGRKTFEFEAKACNDAHVALIGPGGENDILYEIVIGGWQNRQSVIRQRKQGRQVCFNRGRYLNCHQYRRFKITWYNGEIKVLRYVNNVWTDFMAWRDPKPLGVEAIGVSGGLWADVSWKNIK